MTTLVESTRLGRAKTPEPPAPEEKVARYIFSSKHFNATEKRVKPAALLPPNPPQPRESSVFMVDGLSDAGIWDLGVNCVESGRRKMKARADFTVGDVQTSELDVRIDNHPPRHANIVSWPAEKARQKILSLKLAELCSLSVRSQ